MCNLEKGSSQRVVGENFGVAKSTIADIWNERKKIYDSVSTSEPPAFAKKGSIVHHAKFDQVDEASWKWFCQHCLKEAPVSGMLLQEKSHLFFLKLYPKADLESFRGSTG